VEASRRSARGEARVVWRSTRILLRGRRVWVSERASRTHFRPPTSDLPLFLLLLRIEESNQHLGGRSRASRNVVHVHDIPPSSLPFISFLQNSTFHIGAASRSSATIYLALSFQQISRSRRMNERTNERMKFRNMHAWSGLAFSIAIRRSGCPFFSSFFSSSPAA
jgi:hypothetical protein